MLQRFSWPPKRLQIESFCDHWIQIGNGKSLLKRLDFLLDILVWSRWRLSSLSSTERSISEVRLSRIMDPYTIPFLLSAPSWKLEGTTYVQQHEMQFLLAAFGERRIYDRERFALMHPRQISNERKRNLSLFPAVGPPVFVAIDILRLFPRTTSGNQLVIIVTDRYSKHTRAIPTGKITWTRPTITFLDNWILPYGIQGYVLTDSGSQTFGKLFTTLCLFSEVKRLTAAAYNPQEMVNSSIISVH